MNRFIFPGACPNKRKKRQYNSCFDIDGRRRGGRELQIYLGKCPAVGLPRGPEKAHSCPVKASFIWLRT